MPSRGACLLVCESLIVSGLLVRLSETVPAVTGFELRYSDDVLLLVQPSRRQVGDIAGAQAEGISQQTDAPSLEALRSGELFTGFQQPLELPIVERVLVRVSGSESPLGDWRSTHAPNTDSVP